MSWLGGDEIFDPVVQAMIDHNVGYAVLKEVSGILLDKLRDRDWQNEDASLGLFYGEPGAGGVVAAFNERGYVAYGQYDINGFSTVGVPCGGCGNLTYFQRDDDDDPRIVDHTTKSGEACPWVGRTSDGYT